MTAAALSTASDEPVSGVSIRVDESEVLRAGMRAPLHAVRLGKPDDLAFVCDSWTKRAHRGERMRDATRHVRTLLARSGTQLFVAHVIGEPDAILGWAVIEAGRPACVHYVYVRSGARRLGTAASLLSGVMGHAVDYSTAAPRGVVVPKGWALNVGRAKT